MGRKAIVCVNAAWVQFLIDAGHSFSEKGRYESGPECYRELSVSGFEGLVWVRLQAKSWSEDALTSILHEHEAQKRQRLQDQQRFKMAPVISEQVPVLVPV